MADGQRSDALTQVRRVLEQEQNYYRGQGQVSVRGKLLEALNLSPAAQQLLFEGNAQSCYGFV